MSKHNSDPRTQAQLLAEIERLQDRLDEAEQTLDAIRNGEVDALVVAGPAGEQVYSLTSAEHTYRVVVETMHEAALTVGTDGTILFCNKRFCKLMKTPMEETVGRKLTVFVAPAQREPLAKLLADAQTGPVQRWLTLRATDGNAVSTQIAASPLLRDAVTGICLVVADLGAVNK